MKTKNEMRRKMGKLADIAKAREIEAAKKFKNGDRVQIKAEILKDRGYEPSNEVGIIVEGPYNNPKCGPNTYTVNWPTNGMKLSDASEISKAEGK